MRRGLPLDERIALGSGPVDPATGCIPWTGWKHKGYAAMQVAGKKRVLVFHYLLGPAPEGMTRDHECRNRACVNPTHMRFIPDAGNAQNRSARSGSKSGVRGVTMTHNGKWQARYMLAGKSVHVGVFDSIEDAETAVSAARMGAMPFTKEKESTT